MAYTYKDLVNEILESVNEVTLDTDGEFNAAVGFHSYVKKALNTVIQDICNRQDNMWPFQREEDSQVLTAGTQRYNLDSDILHIDWYSFYIDYDVALDEPYARDLVFMNWQEYRRKYRTRDLNSVTADTYSKPLYVTRTSDENDASFIITPKPNAAYTLRWAQYTIPTELSATSDIPAIPQHFKLTVIEGVRKFIFDFREDLEQSAQADVNYKQFVHDMRRTLIPQPDTLTTDQ